MSALRKSDAMWPHASDFVHCKVPRPTLGEELTLARCWLSDERSAESISKLLATSECSECPPPESGLFLTDDDIEYLDNGR